MFISNEDFKKKVKVKNKALLFNQLPNLEELIITDDKKHAIVYYIDTTTGKERAIVFKIDSDYTMIYKEKLELH